MKEFIKTIKAFSDPNRIKIVKMLQHKRMCVCEMRAALGVAQPTLSKHLQKLEKSGFVGYEKDGLWVNYLLADGGRSPYVASLLANLRHWLEEEPEVVRLKKEVPMISCECICRQ
jgi:ArsR family transcriptional regulator, arsenate/arsenite/antimonite-responsive transcriptional repressor